MKRSSEFPFERARQVTRQEVREARKAIAAKTGRRRRRGRPKKAAIERYRAVSIRLHPRVLRWAKQEAKRSRIGYQSVINHTLLKASS